MHTDILHHRQLRNVYASSQHYGDYAIAFNNLPQKSAHQNTTKSTTTFLLVTHRIFAHLWRAQCRCDNSSKHIIISVVVVVQHDDARDTLSVLVFVWVLLMNS